MAMDSEDWGRDLFLDSSLDIKLPASELFCLKCTSNSHSNLKPRFKIKYSAVFDVTVDELFCNQIKISQCALLLIFINISSHLCRMCVYEVGGYLDTWLSTLVQGLVNDAHEPRNNNISQDWKHENTKWD